MTMTKALPLILTHVFTGFCSRQRAMTVSFLSILLLLQQISTITATRKRTSFMDGGLDDEYYVPTDCRDEYEQCKAWAQAGYCEALSDEIRPICRKSCSHACDDGSFYWGEPQDRVNAKGVRAVVSQTLEYLHEVIYTESLYEPVRDRCINKDSQCSYWSTVGECDENKNWMLLNCPAACQLCIDLDITLRCPWDPKQRLSMETGGLDEMFERITTDPKWTETYNVTILSQPSEDGEKEEIQDGGPWVIILDDFLDDDECQALIDAGSLIGYERSTAQAKESSETGMFEPEITDYRTSHQAWCDDDCYENELIQRISDRIGNLTGIPEKYSEGFQLLKYEEGQYYRVHHDYIDLHIDRPMGPRLLTVFLYLNNVGEGGGTRFPELDITVMPQKGRALVWPSVYNDDLMGRDWRTEHEALPVEKGEKYGANAWLHLGDYKAADDRKCVF